MTFEIGIKFKNPIKDYFIEDAEKFAITDEYCRLRKLAVDIINQQLELWNREYVPVKNEADYNRYIAEREQKILDNVNNQEKSKVRLVANINNCEIEGETDNLGRFYIIYYG